MDPLFAMSATHMAELIRRGELRSREAVEAHIAAIERLNPAIGAVVATRFDQARAEADQADELAREGAPEAQRVFHGVPCTIKESFAVAGMPQSGGLLARKDYRAAEDAPTVARLRRTGAIPLGVTNLSELCMWLESDNRVYGRTSNPYHRGRIAGGSSGGEGAIVGAGASPLGLGADIGGSIRLPAFFCGVFGHKPTGTLVPNSGQYPVAHGRALRYMTTGPIVRRAEDLWPALTALAGPDSGDPESRPFELGDPASVRLEGLVVLSVADNGVTPVSRELRQAQRRCADWLRGQGARVAHIKIDKLRRSVEIWGALLHEAGGPSFAELLGEGVPIGPFRELGRWALGRSPHTLPALGLAVFERLPMFTGAQARKLAELGGELRRETDSLLGPNAVMLFPPYPRVAPRHGWPLLRPLQFGYTAVLNALELPSTQVPLGLGSAGLPLGVQVVAGRGRDHLPVAVACQLEKAFGGWTPPPALVRWQRDAAA